MADLNAKVGSFFGRSSIMPSAVQLFTNLNVGEQMRLSSSLPVGQYTPLRPSTMTEAVHVVANTVTRTWNHTGDVAFVAQSDHASNTNYTARVRVSGVSTVVATQDLGLPTPDANNVIVVSLAATFAELSAGNYTVSILTTNGHGSTDSAESNIFSLPIA